MDTLSALLILYEGESTGYQWTPSQRVSCVELYVSLFDSLSKLFNKQSTFRWRRYCDVSEMGVASMDK